jgi:hypothetical protein
MHKERDKVLLSKEVQRWPIELAEALLANPLPWGPPTYALGVGYVDDHELLDQSDAFFELANCVNGAYERHGDIGEAWKWAKSILPPEKAGKSSTACSTQDLLDIVFLYCRGERFSDGLIRENEPLLRSIVQEVVQRINSDTPPEFIIQALGNPETR